MNLRIFKILKQTKVEGPETRYCIWVQGCSHHCKGCQAVHTWSHNDGILVETEDIITEIKKQKGIEGVTFLGGEPFEQAEPLGLIAEECHKNNLSVLCFTGGYIEDLKKEDKNKKLLDNIDILIDSPFEIDKLDYSRPWCGSSNQRYHFLTNKYDETIFQKYKNKIEMNLYADGTVFVNGMGDFNKVLSNIK